MIIYVSIPMIFPFLIDPHPPSDTGGRVSAKKHTSKVSLIPGVCDVSLRIS